MTADQTIAAQTVFNVVRNKVVETKCKISLKEIEKA